MRERTNKQIAADLLKKPHNQALLIEDERLMFALILAGATLKGEKKRQFKEILKKAITKVAQDQTVQSYLDAAEKTHLTAEQAGKLYNDAVDVANRKFYEDPDWKIKLPANMLFSFPAALGCGTSVYQGASKAGYSFATSFFFGLTTTGANQFFLSQAIPGLLSKIGIDCGDFANNRSLKLAVLSLGTLILRTIFAVPTAEVDASFAFRARKEFFGIELIGDATFLATLVAMGLIYDDALQGLAEKLSYPLELCKEVVEAARKSSCSLNIAYIISGAAALTRVAAFVGTAKKIYENDMNFDATSSAILASIALVSESALTVTSALPGAQWVHNESAKAISRIATAARSSYMCLSNAGRVIPTVEFANLDESGNNSEDPEVTSKDESRNNSGDLEEIHKNDLETIGITAYFCQMLSRIYPKIKNHAPMICTMAVLITNATGNMYLADDANIWGRFSIFLMSLMICARSIFAPKDLENISEVNDKIALLMGRAINVEDPQQYSLRDFFNQQNTRNSESSGSERSESESAPVPIVTVASAARRHVAALPL
jgi:hypothetical protein